MRYLFLVLVLVSMLAFAACGQQSSTPAMEEESAPVAEPMQTMEEEQPAMEDNTMMEPSTEEEQQAGEMEMVTEPSGTK